MSEFLGSIWWLIVSLGVLVTFHEFGHYWVARRCGVKVLRFSIGFGKPLWMRRGKDGTEYAIAAIPLGGYVKMLDEREGAVAANEVAQAFNRQSVWKRIAIVVAGPLANLILCVGLFWAMFVIGRPDFAPVVGHATSIAAQFRLPHGRHAARRRRPPDADLERSATGADSRRARPRRYACARAHFRRRRGDARTPPVRPATPRSTSVARSTSSA